MPSPETAATSGMIGPKEIAAALATSFERYERLVLMLMGIPEPDARAMFAGELAALAEAALDVGRQRPVGDIAAALQQREGFVDGGGQRSRHDNSRHARA